MKRNSGQCRWLLISFTLLIITSLSSCDSDVVGPTPNGNNKLYILGAMHENGISGTLTLTELSDGSTSIIVDLKGPLQALQPVTIHYNTAAETGPVALTLNPVPGNSGSSTTIVRNLDNGITISYDQFLQFDGYINVEGEENQNLLAQADIGQNALTGNEESFRLNEVNSSGVSGIATLYERLNNETLVQLKVSSASLGSSDHPAQIKLLSATDGSVIDVDLLPINPATGMSYTNVSELNSAKKRLRYDELLNYDGNIEVMASLNDNALIAQGEMGVKFP